MAIEDVKQLFFELVQTDSHSRQEGAMAKLCADRLKALGCDITFDDAGKALDGETGNLIARLPGDASRDTVLLTSHMDTVVPGEGVKPHVDDDGVVWSDGSTILGADDKAGVTAILLALRELVQSEGSHAPVEVVFTICEEIGLQGARHVDFSQLKSRIGMCMDSGGEVGTMVVAGPAQVKWNATFVGKSAHAGVAPEKGVSAIKMAATAVARMPHGRLSADTTVNIGSFVGEGPTNVVRDKVQLLGEARSLNRDELDAVLKQIGETFEKTASDLGGSVAFEHKLMYEGFAFAADHPLRTRAEQAVVTAGLTPQAVRSGGGADANIFTQNGIETINMGVGYEDIHSTNEHIALEDIAKAARIAVAFCR